MTRTELVNRALAHLGHDRQITDYATDQSTEAFRARQFLPNAIDSVLSAFAWEFAIKTLALTPHVATIRPDDCLRIVDVKDDKGNAVRVDHNGRAMTSPVASTLRYISNSLEIDALPYPVVDAIIAELTRLLFGPMLGNPSSETEMNAYKAFESEAASRLQFAIDSHIAESQYLASPQSQEDVIKTDLVNRALIIAGSTRTISNLETDTSTEAVRARALFKAAMDECLTYHNWDFAAVEKTYSTPTIDQNGFSYLALPTDCYRLINVTDGQGNPLEHRRIRDRLLVKYSDGKTVLRYMSSDFSLNEMPPKFREAFVDTLASLLVVAMESDGKRATEYLNRAQLKRAEAVTVETEETEPRGQWENPFIAARR